VEEETKRSILDSALRVFNLPVLGRPHTEDVVSTLLAPVVPEEAEYHALIRGLKLAAEKGLPYVAAFSDSANVVNQITRGWNKNERATELCKEVEEAREPFKTWQLSWVPREMNREADKLVDQAFKGEPVAHATD
jgi:ribonuclease HI